MPGQGREQQPRVIGEQPDIAEAAPRHLAERAHDAVLEHLAADKPDLRVPLGLGGKVLAGAEADLEPHLRDWFREESPRVDWPHRGWQIDRQLWQQFLLEPALAGPQRPRPPPAVEPAGRNAIDQTAHHKKKLVIPGGRRPRARNPFFSRGSCSWIPGSPLGGAPE